MSRIVLYAHDGPLLATPDGEYYGIHFNDNLRKRFLNLGNAVTFLMRFKRLDRVSKNLQPISRHNFAAVEVPNFKSIKRYWLDINKAKRIIEEQVIKHDVVVARLPSAIGGIALKYARRHNKPVIVEMVACTFDAYWNYNWKGKLIAHYKLWQCRQQIKLSPYVIYVTNSFLQQRYPTLGKSIACSNVELKNLEILHLQNRLDSLSNRNPDGVIKVATVAAIDVPYKGQDDVIRAIYRLKNMGINVTYHLIGKGDKTVLLDLAKKYNVETQIVFHGAVAHAEVFELLQSMDLYIQPSKQEGLPRALIEAMSLALPALGARTAGIPELLSPECIFEPGNINQLVNLIRNAMQQCLEKHARQNFEMAKQYQFEILQNRRLKFYNDFLTENFPVHEVSKG